MEDEAERQEKEYEIMKLQELRELQMKQKFLMNPFSRRFQIWTVYINMMGLAIILLVPFRICFSKIEEQNYFWIISDYVILISYALKIIIEVNSPFQHDNGSIEYDRKKILYRYIIFQFWIDIFTCIPISQKARGTEFYIQNGIRACIFFDCYVKLNSQSHTEFNTIIENFIKQFQIPPIVMYFSKKILIILIIQHFLACIWWGIVQLYAQENLYKELFDKDLLTQYVTCVYFAASLIFTIGYGDYSASITESKIFFIIFTFLNIIIYGYVMADFSSIFNEYFSQERNENIRREQFYFQLQKKYNYSDQFLLKLIQSYQTVQTTKSDQLQIFKMEKMLQLSPNLQEEISLALCKPITDSIEFFQRKPQFFMSQIFSRCQIMHFQKNDEVFKKTSISKNVYFILSGRITQSIQIQKFYINISYVQGSQYGYEDYYMKRKRIGTCYADDNMTCLLVIDNDDYEFCLSLCNFAQKEAQELVKIRQDYALSIEKEIRDNLELFIESSRIQNYEQNLNLIRKIKQISPENQTNYLMMQLLGSLTIANQENQQENDQKYTKKYRKYLKQQNYTYYGNQVYHIELHENLDEIMNQMIEMNQELDKDDNQWDKKYITLLEQLQQENYQLDQDIKEIRNQKEA